MLGNLYNLHSNDVSNILNKSVAHLIRFTFFKLKTPKVLVHHSPCKCGHLENKRHLLHETFLHTYHPHI